MSCTKITMKQSLLNLIFTCFTFKSANHDKISTNYILYTTNKPRDQTICFIIFNSYEVRIKLYPTDPCMTIKYQTPNVNPIILSISRIPYFQPSSTSAFYRPMITNRPIISNHGYHSIFTLQLILEWINFHRPMK